MMKTLNRILVLLIVAAFIFAGCSKKQNRENNMEESSNTSTEMMGNNTMQHDNVGQMNTPDGAIAVIHPTKGNDVNGWISFDNSADGIKVHADLTGLPQGKHGFHIHLYGDCSADDGTSAGTHFNFKGSSKNPPSDIARITGNLGNLMAGQNGEATADTTIKNAVLSGQKSIIGRAVIIHKKGNDPSQPPIGAAGARLGCGVIGRANPESMMGNK